MTWWWIKYCSLLLYLWNCQPVCRSLREKQVPSLSIAPLQPLAAGTSRSAPASSSWQCTSSGPTQTCSVWTHVSARSSEHSNSYYIWETLFYLGWVAKEPAYPTQFWGSEDSNSQGYKQQTLTQSIAISPLLAVADYGVMVKDRSRLWIKARTTNTFRGPITMVFWARVETNFNAALVFWIWCSWKGDNFKQRGWWMTLHGHRGLKGTVIFSSFVQETAVPL